MSSEKVEHNNESINIKPERISRNSFWVFLGQVSTVSISFVTIFILVRYLGPEKFGMYSIAFVLAGLFMPLSDLGFNLHFNKTVSADPSLLKSELSKVITVRIPLAVFFWFVMIAVGYIIRYSNEQIAYIALAGLSMFIMGIGQTFVMAIRAIRRMKYESMATFSGMTTKLIGIILLITLKAGIAPIILAHLSGSVVFLITPILFLRKLIGELSFHLDFNGIKERFKAAIPFGMTAIFVTIYFKIDIIMLSKMRNTSEVGIYNGAFNIILASLILSTPLVVSIFPVLSSLYKKNINEANNIYNKGYLFSLIIGVPAGVGLFFMSDSIVLLAYGGEFFQTGPILAIMAGTIPVLFATHFIGNSMGAVGFQKWVLIVAGINVIFNIVLNFILIPKFGGRGAGIATLATEILGLFLLSYLSGKIFKLDINWKIIRIIIAVTLSACIFLLMDNFLNIWLIAIIFVILYLLLILLLRVVTWNTIMNIVKRTDMDNEKVLS